MRRAADDPPWRPPAHLPRAAGEQNILAQQNKDNSKRLETLGASVMDLAAEVRGEDGGAAAAGGGGY